MLVRGFIISAEDNIIGIFGIINQIQTVSILFRQQSAIDTAGICQTVIDDDLRTVIRLNDILQQIATGNSPIISRKFVGVFAEKRSEIYIFKRMISYDP